MPDESPSPPDSIVPWSLDQVAEQIEFLRRRVRENPDLNDAAGALSMVLVMLEHTACPHPDCPHLLPHTGAQ